MSGPLSSLAVYLGAIALATLAGRGLFRCCRAPLSQPTAWLLAAGLSVAMLVPHFVAGLRDCSLAFTGDGWAYVADAERLWEPSSTGPLSFLQAWATTLSETRHASASLLALLSPLGVAGDPQRVLGLYCALVLFAGACGCGALARRLPAWRPAVFLKPAPLPRARAGVDGAAGTRPLRRR